MMGSVAAKRARCSLFCSAFARESYYLGASRQAPHISRHCASPSKLGEWTDRGLSTKAGDSRRSAQPQEDPGRRQLQQDKQTIRKSQFVMEKERWSNGNLEQVKTQEAWTLSKANLEMAELQNRLSRLKPLPPAWSGGADVVTGGDRAEIYRDTSRWLDMTGRAIQSEQDRLSGKTRRELSFLLGHALSIFSEMSIYKGKSPFSRCQVILKLLVDMNLEPQPSHYAAAVAAAIRESNWKDASDLFLSQIDPDAAGYVPMENTSDITLGLFAIAQHAKSEVNDAVAELVMDAALRMTMVSPSDQDKYVFCAGTALGRAGEPQSCIEYLRNSYNSARLGQALIAAVMQACIICSKHEEALALFDEFASGREGGEYQWGGEFGPSPLCRDLALRALGESAFEDAADRALALFDEIQEERRQISTDALFSVFKVLERDGNYRDAAALLKTSLDQIRRTDWLVPLEQHAFDEITDAIPGGRSESVRLLRWSPYLRQILPTVMRTCNSSGQFGLSLLSCRLAEVASISSGDTTFHEDIRNMNGEVDELVRSLLLANASFGLSQDMLVASMVSLCGLGYPKRASRLYEAALLLQQKSAKEGKNTDAWFDARHCHEHTKSLDSIQGSWEGAHRHIHRIVAAASSLQDSGSNISDVQRSILSSALTKAMRSCTAAGQPEASLFLASHVETVLTNSKSKSVGGAIVSFFGLSGSEEESSVLLSDGSLATEMLRAHSACSGSRYALNLMQSLPWYEELVSSSTDKSKLVGDWVTLLHEILRLLVDVRHVEEAVALLNAMPRESRRPESFLLMARLFDKRRDTSSVGEVYHSAQKTNCLTDELAILTMSSVAKSSIDTGEKLRVTRGIAKEVAQSCGLSQTSWLKHKYWPLKRHLGDRFARLLMWWNDPSASPVHELSLAIKQFDERRELGLRPKHDVVRSIVAGAQRYEYMLESRELMGTDALVLPSNKTEWTDLACLVLDEIQAGPLRRDPRFVDELSSAFFALGAHRECVDFVSDSTSRSVYVNHTALEKALSAADLEGIDARNLSLLACSVEASQH